MGHGPLAADKTAGEAHTDPPPTAQATGVQNVSDSTHPSPSIVLCVRLGPAAHERTFPRVGEVHRERRTLLAPPPVSAVTEARSPSPAPPALLLPNAPLQPWPPLPPCARPAACAAPADDGRRSSSNPPPQRLSALPRDLALAAAAAVRATAAPAAAGGCRSGSGAGVRGSRGTRGRGAPPPVRCLLRRQRAVGEGWGRGDCVVLSTAANWRWEGGAR